MPRLTYKDAGVDIEAKSLMLELVKEEVRSTYGPEVLLGIGAFGGLYNIAKLKSYREPVLVASTDSVGTKTEIAAALRRFDTIGFDIVNHCVNDILVQGANPLFFLDYVASAHLEPRAIVEIVGSVARACREAGCALIKGETAEMPGIYHQGSYDLVGAIVGVVEREEIIDGSKIEAGDVVLGLASSGLHTNGYSLVRKVFARDELGRVLPELGKPLGEELLTPHRSYLGWVERLKERVAIRGLAHITGGGFPDNIPRILPQGLAVEIRLGSWPIPPIFRLVQERGGVEEAEMYHVFNMGIGMVAMVRPEEAETAVGALPGEVYAIGRVVERGTGPRVVLL